MQNDNQKVEFIQELYETYEDIKHGNITLKRIYIILILDIIIVFGLLGIAMLFSREFLFASFYLLYAFAFYLLLLNRKKKAVSKYFDLISFLGVIVITIIAIICNIILYSLSGGSHLHLFLLSSVIYLICIKDSKKRIIIANLIYFILLLLFVALVLLDNFILHPEVKENVFTDILFVLSIILVFLNIVFAANVVGLKSIEDIEKLSSNKNRINLGKKEDNKYNVIEKKDFTQEILQKQFAEYNDINICIFEMSFIHKDKNAYFKIDYYYQNKLMNELLSLLRVYYPDCDKSKKPNTALLIKWDLSSIILIGEEKSSDFYFALESISKDFDKMIRKKDSFDVYLKIVAKYYKYLNTNKRPKILLEKINEVIKLKYETRTMGKEYILYKSGVGEQNQKVL